MSKKQRERKQRKEQQKRHSVAPPNWASGEISPQAREIMDKLGRGSLFRNELELLKAITDSMELRDESEFDDFALDADEVTRVVTPILAAREQDLERARQVSAEEADAVYNEVQMQAVDAVFTRERRREFLQRYDAMLRRLLAGTDTDKIKIALVTRSIFDQKDMPWALAGIVVELFEEARESVLERVETIQEIILESLKRQHPNMTDEELEELLDDPEQLEQALAKAKPSPEQLAELREMTDDILKDFEHALYGGSIPLDLFYDDELEEAARRLNAITQAGRRRDGVLQTPDLEAIAHMLQAYTGEVMTPKRLAALRVDLDAIIREWEQSSNDQSMLLQMERDMLDEVEPAENPFLYGALVGQLRRASGATDEDEIENAEGEPDSSVIDGTVIDSSGI